MATRFHIDMLRRWAGQYCDPALGSGWTAGPDSAFDVIRQLYVGTYGFSGEGGRSVTKNGVGTNPGFGCAIRAISPPLAAQTISGTVKGQFIGIESASGDNCTLAIAIRVVKPDETDRGVLLGVTASDGTATPPEFTVTPTGTNRRLLDASETTPITLTSVDVSEGDRIVVEVGFRQASTTTGLEIVVLSSDPSLSDLAENDTATAAANSWIEFSDDITFADGPGTIWFIGGNATPMDTNGVVASNATATITLTPPSGMRQGDLVAVICKSRSAATWSVGVTGGQTWNEEVLQTADANASLFWCTFNGTWDANPRFDSTSSTCTSAALYAWRGQSTSCVWTIDVAFTDTSFAGPSSPFAVTRTGLTTVRDDAVVLGGFLTADDNSYTLVKGNDDGWSLAGPYSQHRNSAGSDQSLSCWYQIVPDGGTATGNLVRNQVTITGDAGASFIVAFSPVAPQIVAIGLVTETDTVLALTRAKTKAIGLITETDTPFAIPPLRIKPFGLVSEIDTALAFDTSTVIPINLVEEADTPFSIAHALSRSLQLVSETDDALSFGRLKTRAIGLVSETDQAFSFAHSLARAIGLTTEADTAFNFAHSLLRAIGLVLENDSAFAFNRLKTKALALLQEIDTAFDITSSAAHVLGLTSETDTPFALGRLKSKAIGLVTETDIAFAMTHSLARTLSLVIESDAAFSISKQKLRSFGIASETDTALAFVVSKLKSITQALETDTAFSFAHSLARTISLSSESDTAFAFGHSLARAIGLVTEVDTARALSASMIEPIGQAQEIDTPFSISRSKLRSFNLAFETDTANLFAHSKARAISLVSEIDSAFLFTHALARSLGIVTETDTANGFARLKLLALDLIEEIDTAFSIVGSGATLIGQASELDTAFSLVVPKVKLLGFPFETDTAFIINRNRIKPFNLVEESDQPLSFVAAKGRTISRPQELDTATSFGAEFAPVKKQRINYISRIGRIDYEASRLTNGPTSRRTYPIQ